MSETASERHSIVLTDRTGLTIHGVLHVESFDDQEIVIQTELGMLAVRGEELHIKQLQLEAGNLEVEGTIAAIEYLEDLPGGRLNKSRGGLFSRWFGQ